MAMGAELLNLPTEKFSRHSKKKTNYSGSANSQLVCASENGDVQKVRSLLHIPKAQSKLDIFKKRRLPLNQQGIDSAIVGAAKNNHVDVVIELLKLEWLQPNGFRLFHQWHPAPSQNGMNLSLVCASGKGYGGMVRMLVDSAPGRLRPNQEGIIKAYREALAKGKHAITRILDTFIPFREWHKLNEGRPMFRPGDFEFDDDIFRPELHVLSSTNSIDEPLISPTGCGDLQIHYLYTQKNTEVLLGGEVVRPLDKSWQLADQLLIGRNGPIIASNVA